MQDISQMNVENIVSRCSSMFWSGWYVGLCVCVSLSLCVLLFSASSLLTVVAHLSVCLVQLPHTTAAGLLLWAGRAGNIDWLLQQWRANVGSATLSALTLILWHWCWHYQWHCRLTNCVCVIDRCRRYSYVAVPGGWSSVRASDSDVDHTQLLTDSEILHALNQTTPLAHLNRRQVTFPHCTC